MVGRCKQSGEVGSVVGEGGDTETGLELDREPLAAQIYRIVDAALDGQRYFNESKSREKRPIKLQCTRTDNKLKASDKTLISNSAKAIPKNGTQALFSSDR